MKVQPAHSVSARGSRRQPAASRKSILQAALVEFAQEGLAGARVDASPKRLASTRRCFTTISATKSLSTERCSTVSSSFCWIA